jgi:hypothetical protein
MTFTGTRETIWLFPPAPQRPNTSGRRDNGPAAQSDALTEILADGSQ